MTKDKDMCNDFEDNGAVFPKVSFEKIDRMMGYVRYETSIIPGTTTTLIVGILDNGVGTFTLGTAIMACVDKRNFNAELGAKYGIEKCEKICREKLWELEGYLLFMLGDGYEGTE